MYLIIIFLPLLGSIITGFGGRFLGYYGSSIFSTFCVFLSTIFSILVFVEINFFNSVVHLNLTPWIYSGLFELNWSFFFDNLTVIMLIVVTVISTLVHIYSIDYMKNDPHCPRFMAYLGIFTFFMLMLVTSDNLLQMFLGWEGVGLASYLLINFWFTRLSANRAALKALILNRIGDFFLLIAIFGVFFIFKSINYITIFSLVPFFNNFFFSFFFIKVHGLTLVGIFLFFGAIGKSAQLGLHTWLPDAMEGPTPVSALIHAATMVTAGVFLIIRFSPLIEFSSITLFLLIIIGSSTSFFAAVTGTFQYDLKKVVAYSTCSQLGYMIFCCGLSSYNVSIFHLTNHAFFKALLFLGSGSVIHALYDEQDMRRMGSLINFMPITYCCMLLGSLTLIGIPFLTGFYSKDIILEISNIFRNNNLSFFVGSLAFWLGNLSVFFTAYYSFRLIFYTFINNANYQKKNLIHESSYLLLITLLFLSICSIFFGFIFKEFFLGLGVDTWNNVIFMHPLNNFFLESEFLYAFFKWVPFLLSLCGIFVSCIFNLFNHSFLFYFFVFRKIFFFINKKWYFDIFYNKFFVFPLLNFGFNVTFKIFDRGFIELLGPYGLSMLTSNISNILYFLHTGKITHYIYCLVFFTCIFLNVDLISYFYLVIFYFILIFFI